VFQSGIHFCTSLSFEKHGRTLKELSFAIMLAPCLSRKDYEWITDKKVLLNRELTQPIIHKKEKRQSKARTLGH